MILNPNLYKESLDKQRNTVIRGLDDGPKYDILTLLSLGSHIPIVAVLLYALRSDVGGANTQIQQVLDFNMKCYKYEAVTPWFDV